MAGDSVPLVSPTSTEQSNFSLKAVAIGIIILISLCAHVVAVVAIVKEKKLHRAPYYYLINLSINDCLRVLLCHTFVFASLMRLVTFTHGMEEVCKIVAFLNVLFTFNGVFIILILAIDRYLAVVYNRFHVRKIRGLTCLAIMLLSWGLAFMMAFPPIFGLGKYRYVPQEGQCTFQHNYYRMNDTLGFTLIFTIMIMVTGVIFLRIFALMRNRRRMRPVLYQPAVSDNWTFFGPGMIVTHAIRHIRPGANRMPLQAVHGRVGHRHTGPLNLDLINIAQNEKCTRLCFVVHFAFVVLWFPYLIMAYWYMFETKQGMQQWYVTFSTWCTYLYVTVNPVIYVTTCRIFRGAVVDLLCRTSAPERRLRGLLETTPE